MNTGQRLGCLGLSIAFAISLAATAVADAATKKGTPTPAPTPAPMQSATLKPKTIVYGAGVLAPPPDKMPVYVNPHMKKFPDGIGYELKPDFDARTTPSGVEIIEKKSGRVVTTLSKSSGARLR